MFSKPPSCLVLILFGTGTGDTGLFEDSSFEFHFRGASLAIFRLSR
jgi:hypothetical protein